MERAWDFLWDRFFDRRTCLFYDYLVGDREDAATWHLPGPELISRDLPNPCGYGTGMEDSMLTAGSMMDAVVDRYAAAGEEAMRARAAEIYRGMELCMDVCARPGFVARSVSPEDGRSHYTNSSRDQYTHWVWGAWALYHSPLSDEAQRESVRRHLETVAGACLRDVTAENGWNLLREDGKVGIVTQMWGDLAPHEYLRLPMFYAAAWRTGGETKWRDLYREYREEAYEKSLAFRGADVVRPYGSLQMQYSLRLLYEAEDDAAWRERYRSLMERLASEYAPKVAPEARELLRPENLAGLDWEYRPWNEVRAAYVGFIGEKIYYNPGQSEFRENRAFYPLRSIGECASIAALCPGYRLPEGTVEILEEVASAVNYEKHRSYAPLALVNAWWKLRASHA